MRVLMRAYRRERSLGRQHPEWFNWVKILRGLADPAAKGGWIIPSTVETRKQRGRGVDGNDELLSRTAAGYDDRRDRRS